MWDALNPTTKFRKLDEEWATLKESSVYDGDTIIVELASSVAAAENDYAYSSYSKSVIASTPGVCGLGNLGNTCFMNSSLQCLSHTVPLRNYFISGQFLSEINALNLLGTKGELAQAFGALLRDMWSGNHSSVSPRHFKTVLGRHAEQFMGYDQHDSQELIAYLLDGIHEDVNRIEKKPYVEQVEAKDGEPDEGAADRAWDGHLRRNNSKIVELFQGQFKSVVTCPHEGCNRVSVTFDPFMYLSVPLVNDEKSFVVTYIPANGATPRRFNVTVSKVL
jgi:ubiquitin carboxyl-terminal hydrolase 4/11/15